MYSVYFAQSLRNQKVYVGCTRKEPQDRVKEHNQKSNEFTSRNGPFKLIYYEKYHCYQDALSREKFYKMGFGKQIKKVIIQILNKDS